MITFLLHCAPLALCFSPVMSSFILGTYFKGRCTFIACMNHGSSQCDQGAVAGWPGALHRDHGWVWEHWPRTGITGGLGSAPRESCPGITGGLGSTPQQPHRDHGWVGEPRTGITGGLGSASREPHRDHGWAGERSPVRGAAAPPRVRGARCTAAAASASQER